MSLFDPGPALPPEPKLSADAKRTQKRRLLLSQGVHPTTHAPLLIGVGIEEHFIASDVSALLPVTQKVVYLENSMYI